MQNLTDNFLEGIDEKSGKMSGHLIETIYGQLERLELRNGYLAVIVDWQDIEIETRIPLSMLSEILNKSKQP